MHPDLWTLVLQTVNFLILIWLLQRFLYVPVLRMIDAQEADLQHRFDDARAAEDKAKELMAQLEAQRAALGAERDALLSGAMAEAQASAATCRAQAQRDADALIEAGRKTLAAERALALEEARNAAIELGTEMASGLVSEVPLAARAEAWLRRITDYFSNLPAERESLIRQLHDGPLTVVTAAALPEEIAELWRSRLHSLLGSDAIVRFEVDPALLGGADLHFPAAVLRLSWASAASELRSHVHAH